MTSRRLHSLEAQVQRLTADLAAISTEMTENKNETTKVTGLEEQPDLKDAPDASLEDNRETSKKAKLDEKPDMQNILTVSDDSLVNNGEVETLESSQQKKSWWTPWLKTQPTPHSLATPGDQNGSLVPPAHHTPSNQSVNLKQLEADIVDLKEKIANNDLTNKMSSIEQNL